MKGLVLVAGLVLVNLVLDARRRGGPAGGRAGRRGRSVAMGSVGVRGGNPVIHLAPARPRRSLKARAAVGVVKLVVLAAEVRPAVTTVAAAVASVAAWVALYWAGLVWWAALVPTSPLVAVALYAAGRWRRRATADPWVDMWQTLARDVTDRDGKVTQRAVLPGSRVVRPLGRRACADLVVDEATGRLREVVLRVRLGLVAQTVDHVAKASGVIAAAYLTYGECVTVAEGSHKGEAIVRVVPREWADHERAEAEAAEAAAVAARTARMDTRWPLGAQVIERASGRCEIGVAIDTGEPVFWQLFEHGVGAYHGTLAGDTRFGKSTTMETLTKVACRDRIAVPAFVDLTGGVTFDWARSQTRYFAASVAEAEALMAWIDAEYEHRIQVMLDRGWRGVWRPSEQDPVLVVLIDEGPELRSSTKASALLSRAVRMYAKAGICVVFATQSLTIESILGKDAGMGAKSQLMAGNVMSFYASQGLAGIPFDVADIPKRKGLAKLLGPAHPDDAVLLRGLIDEAHRDDLDLPAYDLATSGGLYVSASAGDGAAVSGEGPRPARGPVPDARPWRGVDDGQVATVVELPGAGEPGWLRDPDPVARIRAVLLERGPLTEKELVAATRLSKTTVNTTLPRMAGVTKEAKYGGRWSLMERSQ